MNITVKPAHIAIVGAAVVVWIIEGIIAMPAMKWLETLVQPSFSAPDWLFCAAGPLLFLCIITGMIIAYEKLPRDKYFMPIMGLFTAHWVLCIVWDYFFFYKMDLATSLIPTILVTCVIFAMTALCFFRARTAALLFLPYCIWQMFFVAWHVGLWMLN